MSAAFIIPFDNDPASVSVVTSSYTIPAGKFARVLAECNSGGTVTINGSSVMTTAAFLNIDVSSSSGTSSTYTTPTGYRAVVSGIHQSSGGGSFSVNSNANNLISNDNYSPQFDIGPAGTFTVNVTFNSTRFIQGVAIPSNATERQGTFFLPTGTVLSGSGTWRALVMLYNIIS